MLINLFKIAMAIFVFFVLLFLFLVKFSSTTTKYECTGVFQENSIEIGTGSLFMKYENYRWWVDFWSERNSDGSIWLEIPHSTVNYFYYLKDLGEIIRIYNSPGDFAGQYSKLSQSISIKTYQGVFDGKCKII